MIIGKKTITGLCVAVMLATTGCEVTLTNLTPRSVPANPSRTYTLSASVDARNSDIARESMAMSVVVDGDRRPMKASMVTPNVFEYDYRMPAGQKAARYYYILDYDLVNRSTARPRQVTSELQELTPQDTYIVLMDLSRAPIGAVVTLSGRGFSPTDTVLIGNVEADTEFQSANAISFRVPALTAGRDYQVAVRTREGVYDVGPFRVDATDIQVYPTAVSVKVGQKTLLVLTIPFDASSGGIVVDITTDIPRSVAIPPVTIPSGSSSVSIPVEGLVAGKGILRVQARGFRSIDVPVWVQ